MERTRRVGDVTLRFFLLVLGSVQALPGFNNTTDPSLTCTVDFIEMARCEFKGQQCSQYNLSLENTFVKASCNFRPCGNGLCCCSTVIRTVLGEIINAAVWRGGKRVVSRDINVTYSIKPKAPTIVSVKPSNVNFQVKWKSNMEVAAVVDSDLDAVVTYYKKGDTNKVSKQFKPAAEDQQKFKFHEIVGRDLEPSTTYVVSVKSYLSWSKLFSDPSEEMEFKTPMPYYTIPVAIVVILSISAVIFMGAIYCCYYKYEQPTAVFFFIFFWQRFKEAGRNIAYFNKIFHARAKALWWDGAFKSPNPHLLDMRPSEQKLLKPALPFISSVCVEHPIQDDDKSWSKGLLKDSSDGSFEGSVEVNSGSTVLSYANTAPVDVKAGVQEALGNTFANISPVLAFIGTSPASELHKDNSIFSSPTTLWDSRANNTSSASSCFDNKTYSIVIPGLLQEILANGSTAHLQAEIECDSAYQASEGHAANRSEQLLQTPLMLCGGSPSSSLMQTDMSYQQCKAEPESFSASSFSTVSEDPLPGAEDGHSSGPDKLAVQPKAEAVMVCDQNPCYGAVPAGTSCSFPLVEDGYQPFQSQVVQPDSLCSEEPSGNDLERISAPCFPLPTSVHVGPVSTVEQRPFLQLFSTDSCSPVITDSGYHRV